MPEQSRAATGKVPPLTSDEQAEAFLAQDLSGLDFSQFKPLRFAFEQKVARADADVPARPDDKRK